MKEISLSVMLAAATLSCSAQSKSVEFGPGNLKVAIEQGESWLHDFPLFWFVKMKNSPQIAIWTEDPEGNFLETIYVSKKTARQGWVAAGGNRRKESLPCWSHAQGKQYADGLYLPTKGEPLPDAVTGATPKGSFGVHIQPGEQVRQLIVKCEFNHSVDFNEAYPKDAKEGDANYSGGKLGSGQPAVVYQVTVDLTSGQQVFQGKLIGHSSPDGSDGAIYPDTSKLTTALDIVKSVTVSVNP
ncbi:hypothetical protein GGR06_000181 [Bacteroides reticulotermitis]|uniref:Uncharacterized protein n=3 Tax=Bacteroides reticulotermitis TaxID=1133319 RepID=W4UYJ5_9BACE|nr:hypothetical protein [Bacteroides reticulotermitis]GAE85663.1 hypothetical protein JCM10512_4115 [Bacteroides reticulotermitis JCM 10512]